MLTCAFASDACGGRDSLAERAIARLEHGIAGRDADGRREVPLRRMQVAALVLEARRFLEPRERARLAARALPHARECEGSAARVAEHRAQPALEASCRDRLGRFVRYGTQARDGRRAIAEALSEDASELEMHPRRGDAARLRHLDGVRQDRRAPSGATFGRERRAEPRERLRIVRAIEERALVEQRRVRAEPRGAVRVARAAEHVVPIA